MNAQRLQTLFEKYIDAFEFINNEEHNENYKWVVVQQFKSKFDIDADNFADMLYDVLKDTANLIDNSIQQPFYGLVKYAREEPETVRSMFRDLYQSDNSDLAALQQRIDAFIANVY